jgi:hypothetical protein
VTPRCIDIIAIISISVPGVAAASSTASAPAPTASGAAPSARHPLSRPNVDRGETHARHGVKTNAVKGLTICNVYWKERNLPPHLKNENLQYFGEQCRSGIDTCFYGVNAAVIWTRVTVRCNSSTLSN